MYSKILVPVDGSETSARGLNEAIQLAKVHGSAVCVMHIVNEFVMDYTYTYTYTSGRFSENLLQAMRQGGQEILDAAEKVALSQGIKPTCVLVESIGGVAADMIIDQATKWHADLIVMGTHGRRGILRLAMGSDAEQVVRAAAVPVLLIRSHAPSNRPATVPLQASAA